MSGAVNQPAISFADKSTIAISVIGTASTGLAIASSVDLLPPHLHIYVDGALTCFFELGGSAVAVTIPAAGGANGGFPVATKGSKLIATKGQRFISVIATGAGPTLVYITPCWGMTI